MKLVWTSLALAGMLTATVAAQAQQAPTGTMEKIQSAGKIVLGVRESDPPPVEVAA